MTQEEFDKTNFSRRVKVSYKGGADPLYVVSVDFEERLLGVSETINVLSDGDISWVRCENVDLILT